MSLKIIFKDGSISEFEDPSIELFAKNGEIHENMAPTDIKLSTYASVTIIGKNGKRLSCPTNTIQKVVDES